MRVSTRMPSRRGTVSVFIRLFFRNAPYQYFKRAHIWTISCYSLITEQGCIQDIYIRRQMVNLIGKISKIIQLCPFWNIDPHLSISFSTSLLRSKKSIRSISEKKPNKNRNRRDVIFFKRVCDLSLLTV